MSFYFITTQTKVVVCRSVQQCIFLGRGNDARYEPHSTVRIPPLSAEKRLKLERIQHLHLPVYTYSNPFYNISLIRLPIVFHNLSQFAFRITIVELLHLRRCSSHDQPMLQAKPSFHVAKNEAAEQEFCCDFASAMAVYHFKAARARKKNSYLLILIIYRILSIDQMC